MNEKEKLEIQNIQKNILILADDLKKKYDGSPSAENRVEKVLNQVETLHKNRDVFMIVSPKEESIFRIVTRMMKDNYVLASELAEKIDELERELEQKKNTLKLLKDVNFSNQMVNCVKDLVENLYCPLNMKDEAELERSIYEMQEGLQEKAEIIREIKIEFEADYDFNKYLVSISELFESRMMDVQNKSVGGD